MSWLKEQKDGLLVDWITRTSTPMYAALPSGEILWVNHAFEGLIHWSGPELIGKLAWTDLVSDGPELRASAELVNQVLSGERSHFQLQQSLSTKNGAPVRVVVDVLRYPLHGDFRCLLCSSIPTDRGIDFALGQLTEIRTLLLEMMTRVERPDRIDRFFGWVRDNPKLGWPVIVFFGILLFGSRVVELLHEFAPTLLPAVTGQ